MNASCSHRRIWAILLCISLLFTPSFVLAQRPPGLPADAYNAAATTTGVFVNGDELYAGNPGQYSFYSAAATGSVAIWKRIYVPEPSKLVAVTGNGVGGFLPNNGVFPQGIDSFRVTVDPDDMNVATLDLRHGAVVRNEQLEVTQYIARGFGVPSASFTREYDILAEPFDGEGFILQPGYYYVSVLGQEGAVSRWVWTELRPSSAPSDYIRGGADPVTNYGRVIDSALFGGFQAESGDMAFDIWMVPIPDGTCDSGSVGSLDFTSSGEKPVVRFVPPLQNIEVHEENEWTCADFGGGVYEWQETGQSRYTMFNTTGCVVISQGSIVPVTDPAPECGFLGFSSTTVGYVDPALTTAWFQRESCDGSPINGYSFAGQPFLAAGTKLIGAPACVP